SPALPSPSGRRSTRRRGRPWARSGISEPRYASGLVPLRHPPVGVAEGEALVEDETVGLLDGVELGVEADGVAVEADAGEGSGEDGEGLLGEVDAAEERGLQELEVAAVARGELGGHGERLEETAERCRTAAADQLEDVRVALLRHDRGAR